MNILNIIKANLPILIKWALSGEFRNFQYKNFQLIFSLISKCKEYSKTKKENSVLDNITEALNSHVFNLGYSEKKAFVREINSDENLFKDLHLSFNKRSKKLSINFRGESAKIKINDK